MPETALQIKPGFNTTVTQSQNQNGWSFCNLVRWKFAMGMAYLEKLGGWQRLVSATTAAITRAMHAYQDLQLNNTLLIGTDSGAQALIGSTIYTFTTVRRLAGVNDSTIVTGTPSIGSASILVQDFDHGASVGDTIVIPITITIGGRIIVGGSSFTVATVVDADNYRFNMSSLATTTSGGRVPTFTVTSGTKLVTVALVAHGLSIGNSFVLQYNSFFINTANPAQTISIPAGTVTVVSVPTADTFTFNLTENASYTLSGSQNREGRDDSTDYSISFFLIQYPGAAIPSSPQNWFLDNLGNNGLISYTNGPLYVYSPPIVPAAPIITSAGNGVGVPTANIGMFVAMPQAQVILFGTQSTIGTGIPDPLLVRWSDPGSYSDWTPSSTNQAGSYRLSRGSKIVGGIQGPQVTLLWTDTDVWSMAYVGFPLVYSFNLMAAGCGLISPKAQAILGTNVYWMGIKGFWMLSGNSVRPLDCPVWDQIYPLLDEDNVDKIFAASNSSFQEVLFFFPPSGGTGEPTSYVKLTVMNGQMLWDYGALPRSAWIDESVFGTPLGADQTTRRIQQHEVGYNDDDEAMADVYAETGYAALGDGTYMMLCDRVIPDMNFAGDLQRAAVNMILKTTSFPGETAQTIGPLSVTNETRILPFRGRGRLVATRFEWAERIDFNARVGLPRFRIKQTGKW